MKPASHYRNGSAAKMPHPTAPPRTRQTDGESSSVIASMTFKELVQRHIAGATSFDELSLEIRCESCYSSVFDEIQDQLGAKNPLIEQLADAFPNYHQSLVKERGLEI